MSVARCEAVHKLGCFGGRPAGFQAACSHSNSHDCFSTIENGLLRRFSDHPGRRYRRLDNLQESHDLVFRQRPNEGSQHLALVGGELVRSTSVRIGPSWADT